MMFWSDTVTIYNRSVAEDGRVTWASHVHVSCFWYDKTGRSSSGGAATHTATRIVRVPGKVRINVGDIVVCGAVPDVIDEYTAGSRSTDLKKRYDAFIVSAVHDNARSGRPYPHTYAEGA